MRASLQQPPGEGQGRRFRHNIRRHVERQRLLPGLAAEVLFVRQIELVLAGELAELRRIKEHVEETARLRPQASRRKASHPC